MVDIGYVLSQWEGAGVFDYILPALLIFAVVFGILQATRVVGANKGVHIIIALAIAGLAIGYGRNFIGTFFRETFSQLGIGLAVLLALLILVGLFITRKEVRYWAYGFAAVGFVIWILIMINSLGYMGWGSWYIMEDYAGLIIGAILLIGIIIAVAASGGKGEKPKNKIEEWLGEALRRSEE